MPSVTTNGAVPSNGDGRASQNSLDVDQVDEDDERLVMDYAENNSSKKTDHLSPTGRPSFSTNERSYNAPPSSFSIPKRPSSEKASTPVADFFSAEVFRIVLHNPATAHRLLRYSQARMCGENMEFLEKVDRYNALLDEMMTILSEIHNSYTSLEAPRQIGAPPALLTQLNTNIKKCTTSTLPSMESLFADTQSDVENILKSSVYPRFVKYQMTNSAARALSSDRQRYQGLGDCFCLTDPRKADNPIVFASDGFVAVTGYARTEVVPRNCRFLQGNQTDRIATKRLRDSIDAREETVELLLNYKKNGEPFWNLLYVAPLYDVDGNLVFYLGGQINCSTTIRSNTDVLRILSASDEQEETVDTAPKRKPSKRGLLGHFRKMTSTSQAPPLPNARDAGMEQGLLKQIGKLNFRAQMEKFYTAYSKYLLVKYPEYVIEHFSAGLTEALGVTGNSRRSLTEANVFKVLAQHATALPREFKYKIKRSIKQGQPISASIDLVTVSSLTKAKLDDDFVTHWTPVKDEKGDIGYVVMTLSPSSYV